VMAWKSLQWEVPLLNISTPYLKHSIRKPLKRESKGPVKSRGRVQVKIERRQVKAHIGPCLSVADATLDQNKTIIWCTMNRRVWVQIKDMNIKKKTRLLLITGSRNKTWVQLVLKKVRNNVPWLSIYILDIYFTLLAAQAISKAVVWASS
jgi:hypothetical protein